MDRRGGLLALSLLIAAAFISGCGLASGNFATKAAFANVAGTVKTQQISSEGKSTLQTYLAAGELPDLQYPDFPIFAARRKNFMNPRATASVDHRTAAFGASSRNNSGTAAGGQRGIESGGLRWPALGGTTGGGVAGRAPEPELVRFDLAVTISTMRYISDLHRGSVNPREFHFDLDIEERSSIFRSFCGKNW